MSVCLAVYAAKSVETVVFPTLCEASHKVGNVKLVIMESKVPKHREFAVKGLIFLSII